MGAEGREGRGSGLNTSQQHNSHHWGTRFNTMLGLHSHISQLAGHEQILLNPRTEPFSPEQGKYVASIEHQNTDTGRLDVIYSLFLYITSACISIFWTVALNHVETKKAMTHPMIVTAVRFMCLQIGGDATRRSKLLCQLPSQRSLLGKLWQILSWSPRLFLHPYLW